METWFPRPCQLESDWIPVSGRVRHTDGNVPAETGAPQENTFSSAQLSRSGNKDVVYVAPPGHLDVRRYHVRLLNSLALACRSWMQEAGDVTGNGTP